MPAVPDKYFDGTNPILTITGDEPTERDVSMTNNASIVKTELLTNIKLPPGQTVLVRVKGDVAFDQILSNLAAVNALEGFEVIGVTNVPVTELPEGWQVTNAIYEDGALVYDGGLTAGNPQLAVSLPIQVGDRFQLTLPETSFVRVMVLVSQSPTANMTDWPNNFFGDGIGMSAGSFINMNVDGTVDPEKIVYDTDQYSVQAKVGADNIKFYFYDSSNGFVVTHTINKAFDPEQPFYLHLVADLYGADDSFSLRFTPNIVEEQ